MGQCRDDAVLKVHDVYYIYFGYKENIFPTCCFPLRFWVVEGIINKYWITGVLCVVFAYVYAHILYKFLSKYIDTAREKLSKVST